jgi:hypothetical protein
MGIYDFWARKILGPRGPSSFARVNGKRGAGGWAAVAAAARLAFSDALS